MALLLPTREGLAGKLSRSAIVASVLAGIAAPVAAKPVSANLAIDCPLRDAGWSVDSPLIDVLLKPEAKALLDQIMPNLGRGFPPGFLSTQAPSFAAIVTPRFLASASGATNDDLTRLDASLRRIPARPGDGATRCARYDDDAVRLSPPPGRPRLLVFEKINGFRDGPSVEAARAELVAIARRRGWSLTVTDRAGAMTTANLARFDAVIWNNVSGDVLTLRQRAAFRRYVERGGGYVGLHGSAGDPVAFWDWYVDDLVGARFVGHPMSPQFQATRVTVEPNPAGIGRTLGSGWTMTDEWYSFRRSPRGPRTHVVATIDEAGYSPVGFGGQDLRMGDHPIAWTREVGRGRSFYSAIGHLPATYADPRNDILLEDAIAWAANATSTRAQDVRRGAPAGSTGVPPR